MITIDSYTGDWQSALDNKPIPRLNSLVRYHAQSDDREASDFERHLKSHKLQATKFVRWHSRLRMNVYRITAAEKPT